MRPARRIITVRAIPNVSIQGDLACFVEFDLVTVDHDFGGEEKANGRLFAGTKARQD
jgi:hypothetical protein